MSSADTKQQRKIKMPLWISWKPRKSNVMRKRMHLLMVQTILIHSSRAIVMAIEQGKDWASSEEREKYLLTLLDGEFITPLFAEKEEEPEKNFERSICNFTQRRRVSRRIEIGPLLLIRKMRQVLFSTIAMLWIIIVKQYIGLTALRKATTL